MGLTSSKVAWDEIPGMIHQMSKFVDEANLWDPNESAVLKEYFSTLIKALNDTSSGYPWSRFPGVEYSWETDLVLSEHFRRVKLAVPKSDKCAELFRWSDWPGPAVAQRSDPIHGSEDDFLKFPRQIQIGLSHLYALFYFLWAIQDRVSPVERFYRSDIPYYMYLSDNDINSVQVDTFLRALEKITFDEVTLDEEQFNEEKCGACARQATFARGGGQQLPFRQGAQFVRRGFEQTALRQEQAALRQEQAQAQLASFQTPFIQGGRQQVRQQARQQAVLRQEQAQLASFQAPFIQGGRQQAACGELGRHFTQRRQMDESEFLCSKHRNCSPSDSCSPSSRVKRDCSPSKRRRRNKRSNSLSRSGSSTPESIHEKLDLILHRLEVIYFTQSKCLPKIKSKRSS